MQEESPLYPGTFGLSQSPCIKVKISKTSRTSGIVSFPVFPYVLLLHCPVCAFLVYGWLICNYYAIMAVGKHIFTLSEFFLSL